METDDELLAWCERAPDAASQVSAQQTKENLKLRKRVADLDHHVKSLRKVLARYRAAVRRLRESHPAADKRVRVSRPVAEEGVDHGSDAGSSTSASVTVIEPVPVRPCSVRARPDISSRPTAQEQLVRSLRNKTLIKYPTEQDANPFPDLPAGQYLWDLIVDMFRTKTVHSILTEDRILESVDRNVLSEAPLVDQELLRKFFEWPFEIADGERTLEVRRVEAKDQWLVFMAPWVKKDADN